MGLILLILLVALLVGGASGTGPIPVSGAMAPAAASGCYW